MAVTITVRRNATNKGNEGINVILGKIKGFEASVGTVSIGFSNVKRHYSGMTMAALARLLARGESPVTSFGEIDTGTGIEYRQHARSGVPPRDALKQYMREFNVTDTFRREVMRLLSEQSRKKSGDFTMANAYKAAGKKIKSSFTMFVHGGGVTPENTPWTLREKAKFGSQVPWVRKGDLVESLTVSFRPKKGAGLLKVIEGLEQ